MDRIKKKTAQGPLRRCETNPRYFSHDGKRPVYLTAFHTWSNLVDMDHVDPPRPFDFGLYLDTLEKLNHNFIRLWTFEMPTFKPRPDEKRIYAQPLPWLRTGPGKALDGKPKFDLHAHDPAYFERIRERVRAAGERGIYVSIMLFEGWAIHFPKPPDDWQSHPFNGKNNINGIDADKNGDGNGREYHMLAIPEVTARQEAFVRKVVDTVNEFDNVLYEITNESSLLYSYDWQCHMVRFIKKTEAEKPKQHPVGMTGYGPCENNLLYKGPADWISPGAMTVWKNEQDPFKVDPPINDGQKVSLLDTDHLWGVGGDRQWVWKSFLRGHNPLLMDHWPHSSPEESVFDVSRYAPDMIAKFATVRRNMGYARSYAERINLARMVPCNHLCLSTFCLADPGREYLCYLPNGGKTAVDLSKARGELCAEWFHPGKGKVVKTQKVAGGDIRHFTPPFRGDAVLYIFRAEK